eukprot:CAMPEP_0113628114 /NCGR_PEP_ID=MMETSP0017_2-20120614/14568_1 /TAXON_ID=2856 /ORGANISM="Cylindrotheca closterium" /LENGTH=897 /DNA_ID=CAMNT_0000538409 /DNA_START=59 /DNA_END=2752 /DNA_ORIENTATION=- /assembly_acc=CAM_ASM_000147
MSCVEKFGNTVEHTIGGFFHKVGLAVGNRPRLTILICFIVTALTGYGFTTWETENRQQKLWVPQDTLAQDETERYQNYFASNARFNSVILSAGSGGNVLTKESLVQAMEMHKEIETKVSLVEDKNYTLTDLCVKAGGSCASGFQGVCLCLVNSILKQWNYDVELLNSDTDFMTTLTNYGSKESLEAVLGNPTFDDNGNIVSAEAFTITYFLESNMEVVNGREEDPINEGWEETVFLSVAEGVDSKYSNINSDYISSRSFSDEFGGAITGDLLLVQISYVVAFLYLGANMGNVKCGTGSRWTMAFSALMVVILSTGAGFGVSSIFGFFFGPVHSLLPFILLGIGVDDAFVIVNAFNRERDGPRSKEDNEALTQRCARALARAGASITVTSLTDLVAFGISASSSLPALASFCAYASFGILFLWIFASTFFSATMVLDERRQRDNRRECLCCLTRKVPMEEDEDTGFEEGRVSRYFRNYHAPAILSIPGKFVTLLVFTGLLAFGIFGMLNLSVEDSQRSFIPDDSYLLEYFDAADKYYPSTGIELAIVFEGSSDIYASREALATLDERLAGKSTKAPYIAEPISDTAYTNIMAGFSSYLKTAGSNVNVTLGSDGWPATEAEFVTALTSYAGFGGAGSQYNRDFILSADAKSVDVVVVKSEYVRLTKQSGDKVIDDADSQIEAMDETRALVSSWTDLPQRFTYSEKFIGIESFKVIKKELFLNVGLAILAVAIIVFFTVASPMTSFLITINVAACIIEILGFMYALGIVIDSVSVINMVLAVGLSVDYSAHVGHCFMVKGGEDKNKRALEALADMGASVLNGAISTFLAVVVLLFSSSYVFRVLSTQFALTVGLGVLHGLVGLPVMLSVLGPKPFASAKDADASGKPTSTDKASDEELDA